MNELVGLCNFVEGYNAEKKDERRKVNFVKTKLRDGASTFTLAFTSFV